MSIEKRLIIKAITLATIGGMTLRRLLDGPARLFPSTGGGPRPGERRGNNASCSKGEQKAGLWA